MKVAVRKVQVEDVAKVQMLVAENIDAIEPGLVVLDSRLLLGHTTIDVVGLDANGALVLIATGLTANEEMLLKAVEAYSWSREYPESLERLYPTCVISDERPPRLVFVVERMPDAFHRKIKQLGFPEVDCVEFRLLDVDGVPAVYFESVLRLRRPMVVPPATPRIEAAPEAPVSPENVIPMNGPIAARATSLKLQKLLDQATVDRAQAPRASERPVLGLSRPQAVTVRDVAPLNAAPAVVRQPAPVVVPGPVILTPEPAIATPEPVVVAPAPVIVTPEPLVLPTPAAGRDAQMQPVPDRLDGDVAMISEDAVEANLDIPSLAAPGTNGAPSTTDERMSLRSLPELSLRPTAPVTIPRPASTTTIPFDAPSVAPASQPAAAGQNARVSFKGLSGALLGAARVQATPTVEPGAPVIEPMPSAPLELVMPDAGRAEESSVEPVDPAIADALAELEPALTVEALINSTVEAPAAAAPTPQPAQPAPALPLEFAGLQFPKDGVMTRQWMEFLSQISNTK